MSSTCGSSTASATIKKPLSPYSARQSPRLSQSNKTKMWRSVSATGQKHIDYPQVESMREAWLKSLRQGTDGKRNSSKSMDRTNGSLNASKIALGGSSEYLKEQLGLTNSYNRGKAVTSTSRPGTPAYRPQEEMYEDILQLKKTIASQKSENDTLKSKVRRCEEDIGRKEKCIDQLIEQFAPENKGKTVKDHDNRLIITTLRSRQHKLEQNLKDKDAELLETKNRLKDLRKRAKKAKEFHVKEMTELQEVASNNILNMRNDSEGNYQSEDFKVESLRESVVKLTSENSSLKEENRSLRRDLDHALDEHGSTTSDDDKEQIKYSALNRAELVSIIKKGRKKDAAAFSAEREESKEQIDRLRSQIVKLKDDKNELRNTNNQQLLKIEELQDEKARLEEIRRELISQNDRKEERKRSVHKPVSKREDDVDTDRIRARKNKAAQSIQQKWREHQSQKKDNEEDGIMLIQSYLRAHLARREYIEQQTEATSTLYNDANRLEKATSRRSPSIAESHFESDY